MVPLYSENITKNVSYQVKRDAKHGGVVFFLQIVAGGTNVRDLLRSYFSTIRFKWGKTYY